MKLDQYLRENALTHADFALRIGCEQPSVTRFVKGRRVPSPELMRRIAAETCGAVTANDFYEIEGTASQVDATPTQIIGDDQNSDVLAEAAR